MCAQFGAEGHELDQPWAKRVNLGLAAASVGMLGAHLSHWSLITPLAAMSGCATVLAEDTSCRALCSHHVGGVSCMQCPFFPDEVHHPDDF